MHIQIRNLTNAENQEETERNQGIKETLTGLFLLGHIIKEHNIGQSRKAKQLAILK